MYTVLIKYQYTNIRISSFYRSTFFSLCWKQKIYIARMSYDPRNTISVKMFQMTIIYYRSTSFNTEKYISTLGFCQQIIQEQHVRQVVSGSGNGFPMCVWHLTWALSLPLMQTWSTLSSSPFKKERVCSQPRIKRGGSNYMSPFKCIDRPKNGGFQPPEPIPLIKGWFINSTRFSES